VNRSGSDFFSTVESAGRGVRTAPFCCCAATMMLICAADHGMLPGLT
jgi:hypothetical protein